MLTTPRLVMLLTLVLLPISAFGEIVCSGSAHCFDHGSQEPVSQAIEAEVRFISDEYIRLLLSENFEGSEHYWSTGTGGIASRPGRAQKTRENLGFDGDHIETYFRQVFSVLEVNGKKGQFVVLEYGTRTADIDVLHFVA